MRTRARKKIKRYMKNNCVDMIRRYDGVYSSCCESNFRYCLNKICSKFRNIFKR